MTTGADDGDEVPAEVMPNDGQAGVSVPLVELTVVGAEAGMCADGFCDLPEATPQQ